jgi:hypothetical protein
MSGEPNAADVAKDLLERVDPPARDTPARVDPATLVAIIAAMTASISKTEALGPTVMKAVAKVLSESLARFEARLTSLETTATEKRIVRDERGRSEKLVSGTSDAQALRDKVASLEATVAALVKRLEAAETQAKNFGYRGTWKSDTTYRRGNFCTDSGSHWHAEVDMPTSRPGRESI